MQHSYSLNLFTSLRQGKTFVKEITGEAQMWRRSIRFQGGYWRGEFKIVAPLDVLVKWFHEYLGYHVEENSGGQKSWEGLIYEMTLNTGRASRRRSLDLMYNYVGATYIDSTDTVGSTSKASQDESIDRYGRREELLSMDNFDETPAEARRDLFLARHAWPWARPVGGDLMVTDTQTADPELDVVVCGYGFTANWRFCTTANDATDDLSDWLSAIISTDCEYLTAGLVETNTLQVVRTLDIPQRSWDTIMDLVELGDASGNLTQFRVTRDRYAEYRIVSDMTPGYYVKKNKVYLKITDSKTVNPWLVQPGVFRDLDYPVSRVEQGSIFDDGRDFLVDEITMSANVGLTWTALEYDEAELLEAQQEYEQWLSNRENGVATSSAERLNWKRRIGLTPGTPEWERAKNAGYREKQELIDEWKAGRKRG